MPYSISSIARTIIVIMSRNRAFHVIYLTGPPASGKTTLVDTLERCVKPIECFRYGALLRNHLETKQDQQHISYHDLRQQSAKFVSPDDIRTVDRLLIDAVNTRRGEVHIVIDSHPVTKEEYGFRVTPFSEDTLRALAPTMICMLYVDASTIVARISNDPQGRSIITEAEAAFHCQLQASVAVTYGVTLGLPIYFLNSAQPLETVVESVVSRLKVRDPDTEYTRI